jgi:hypothetical protein
MSEEAKQDIPAKEVAEKKVQGDDRIDVRGMIKQASTRIRVDQLVKKGTKYLSLLSKRKIDELVNQSVQNIIQKHRSVTSGVAPETLEKESKEEFNELLTEFKKASEAKNQLAETKESLDIELTELRKELDKQKGVSEGKLTEDAEMALVLGFKEFEIELEKLVVGVFDRRKLILENSDTPEAVAEMGAIQNRIQAMVSKLVGLERERFMSEGGYSRDREIALMERRIVKLHEQIASMEKALKTITNSKVYSNTQIQNVLRQFGLYEEDKNYEKKKEMVKVLLTQNLDLIKQFNKMEPKDSETVENSTSV